MRVKWQPYNAGGTQPDGASLEVAFTIANSLPPPRLGAHRAKCASLSDGRILVVAYDFDATPKHYIIIPPIPL